MPAEGEPIERAAELAEINRDDLAARRVQNGVAKSDAPVKWPKRRPTNNCGHYSPATTEKTR